MSTIDTITDRVNDLTEPRRHREQLDQVAYRVRRHAHHPHPGWHIIAIVPSLLDQLRTAITWDTSGDDATTGARGPITGNPPGNENALYVLCRIDTGANQWIAGEGRPELDDRIRGLVGLATRLGPDDLDALRRDLGYWCAIARVETGWEPRAVTINQPCPTCEHRNSLRVRGDGTAARCNHCQAAWSEDPRDDLPSVLDLGAKLRHAKPDEPLHATG